jgi:hypothetical protein
VQIKLKIEWEKAFEVLFLGTHSILDTNLNRAFFHFRHSQLLALLLLLFKKELYKGKVQDINIIIYPATSISQFI